MQEIYNELVKVFNQLIRSNKDASAICQTIALDGQKRQHEAHAVNYYKKLFKLKRKVFDHYRFMPADDNSSEPYTFATLKEHLPKWSKFVKANIDNLIGLNKQLYDTAGIEDCTVKCVIDCLKKDYEKTEREIKQFTESGWNPIEIHAKDREKHGKFKELMKKWGIR